MSTISLTVPANTVTVAGGRAELTASVTNGSPVRARIVLGAFGPPGDSAGGASALGWTSIDHPARDIPAGATEQFAVTFAPDPGTAPGGYPVRLIAYSAEQAPEENADQAQTVEVVVPEAAPPPPVPRKRWWPYAVVAAVLVVAVGLVAWLLLPGGDKVAVPHWIGDDRQQVQEEADDLGLEVRFTERLRNPGSDALPGTVLDQDPAPGTEVAPNSRVSVIVVLGIVLPDWRGLTQAEVEARAAELGLTGVSFSWEVSAEDPGTVIDQAPPAGVPVSPDEAVTVVVATSPFPWPTFDPRPTIVDDRLIEVPLDRSLDPVGR